MDGGYVSTYVLGMYIHVRMYIYRTLVGSGTYVCKEILGWHTLTKRKKTCVWPSIRTCTTIIIMVGISGPEKA